MNVLYARVSSIQQRTDRQRVNEQDFSIVIEDRCSGAISFFDREGGKEIKKLLDKGILSQLSVISIDRLGRNLLDILKTIEYFTQKNVPIYFISQSLKTMDSDGRENPISKLLISVLGILSEHERNLILERQKSGIMLAVARGKYKGRKRGTSEDTLSFLGKTKNSKALYYLRKGLSCKEAAMLSGVSINTMTKIRKLGMANINRLKK